MRTVRLIFNTLFVFLVSVSIDVTVCRPIVAVIMSVLLVFAGVIITFMS